jgi:hypothetical protein
VLWESEEEIQLLTKELFVNGICTIFDHEREWYLKLNSFSREKLMWDESLTHFKKNKHMGQCMLMFKVMLNQNEEFMGPTSINEQIKDLYYGLVDILSQAKNFTPAIIDFHANFLNHPTNEKIKGTVSRYVILDLLFFDTLLPLDSLYKAISFTLPVDNDEIFLMVTPGEPYTDYEKLLLPFDDLTWIFLLITFGTAFLSIFGINLMSRKIQIFVYGEKFSTPAYNVVGKFHLFPIGLRF